MSYTGFVCQIKNLRNHPNGDNLYLGECFGKDHTTVLYNVKKIEEFLKDKPYEKEMIENMIRNLQASQG